MNTDDLERLVDQELKRLPSPRAPGTLLPRVLSATVERPADPWYARPWLAWPVAWQAASVTALLVLGTAVWFVLPFVPRASGRGAAEWALSAAASVTTLANLMAQAATLARVLCRLVLGPVALALLILAVWLSLSCAALRAALERFALGERS